MARQLRGEVRTIERDVLDYLDRDAPDVRHSLDAVSLNNDLLGGDRGLLHKTQSNTSMDLKTHENDEVFDQILEHIIKNNDDLANIKKFRRFRLQRQKDEEQELTDAEKYKGFRGQVRRVWDKTKQVAERYMPKAVR